MQAHTLHTRPLPILYTRPHTLHTNRGHCPGTAVRTRPHTTGIWTRPTLWLQIEADAYKKRSLLYRWLCTIYIRSGGKRLSTVWGGEVQYCIDKSSIFTLYPFFRPFLYLFVSTLAYWWTRQYTLPTYCLDRTHDLSLSSQIHVL